MRLNQGVAPSNSCYLSRGLSTTFLSFNTFSGVNTRCTRFQTCKELLQSVRRINEEGNEVSVTDMIKLEEELRAALMHTRSRKTQLMMERISTFHEQERRLTQEKEELKQELPCPVRELIHEDTSIYLICFSLLSCPPLWKLHRRMGVH
ncbi:hypothetical protein L2E82_17722 [Cichorium intybus]|uniref:Uncharacterized protein n=1 Tax=Cichorium intybus TaxID=13427 RepID=A0ACB9FA33_CICIN|nr:hypothetical protein L2E82_17722 [Cichorium intybus]